MDYLERAKRKSLQAQERTADYIACLHRDRGQPLGHSRCKEIRVHYFARVISCHVFGLLVTNSILFYLMDEAKRLPSFQKLYIRPLISDLQGLTRGNTAVAFF